MEDVYLVDDGGDDANLDNSDGWLDLGPKNPIGKEAILQANVNEVKKKGHSDYGFKAL